MKNLRKKGKVTDVITVILIVASCVSGFAQTSKSPKQVYTIANQKDLVLIAENLTYKTKTNDEPITSDSDKVNLLGTKLPQYHLGREDSLRAFIHKNPYRSGSNKAYLLVEKMPQFPGGEFELTTFILKNTRSLPISYPDELIPGKVIVQFIITKTGAITNVRVIKSLDPKSDKEAIRVIKLLPKFIPGEQNGKKVAVYYTLPVTFELE